MKSVIKKQLVREGDAVRKEHAEVRPAAPTERSTPAPPGVAVVRVDGRIQALEVTCRCGEVSVVEIEYED